MTKLKVYYYYVLTRWLLFCTQLKLRYVKYGVIQKEEQMMKSFEDIIRNEIRILHLRDTISELVVAHVVANAKQKIIKGMLKDPDTDVRVDLFREIGAETGGHIVVDILFHFHKRRVSRQLVADFSSRELFWRTRGLK